MRACVRAHLFMQVLSHAHQGFPDCVASAYICRWDPQQDDWIHIHLRGSPVGGCSQPGPLGARVGLQRGRLALRALMLALLVMLAALLVCKPALWALQFATASDGRVALLGTWAALMAAALPVMDRLARSRRVPTIIVRKVCARPWAHAPSHPPFQLQMHHPTSTHTRLHCAVILLPELPLEFVSTGVELRLICQTFGGT